MVVDEPVDVSGPEAQLPSDADAWQHSEPHLVVHEVARDPEVVAHVIDGHQLARGAHDRSAPIAPRTPTSSLWSNASSSGDACASSVISRQVWRSRCTTAVVKT